MQNEHRLELFSCRASKSFAEKVVTEINAIKNPDEPLVHLGGLEVTSFSVYCLPLGEKYLLSALLVILRLSQIFSYT